MDEWPSKFDYPVLIRECKDGYQLRIRELLLTVHGKDLQRAYDELMRVKSELVDLAQSFNMTRELPAPGQAPPLRARMFEASGIALPWLCWIRRKVLGQRLVKPSAD